MEAGGKATSPLLPPGPHLVQACQVEGGAAAERRHGRSIIEADEARVGARRLAPAPHRGVAVALDRSRAAARPHARDLGGKGGRS